LKTLDPHNVRFFDNVVEIAEVNVSFFFDEVKD